MPLDIDTVLVANRGEIACRILRTARALGLRTVAIYSDADRAAPHVGMADRAVRLGPGPAAQSYLLGDRVIEAALTTGAEAIHPGYGFLSESADFAAEVERAGIVFVGPTPRQLALFGDKHAAREAARAAGVPLIAGTGVLGSADEAVEQARRIGLPVMVKATGGGGGVGIQQCRTVDDVRSAVDRVGRLAASHFSTSEVFLEKLVERARHVEVQIFGDGAGRVVDLGTRDCTLQRRHQKVIEEAPASGLPDDLVERLRSWAGALTRSADYRSAGTVEFVVDADIGEASFLEVNPRLQVEHPVTEAITGVDLVEWMLRLAGGDRSVIDDLPGDSVPISGHAVEARIYAEDPARDHRPCAGTITGITLPDDVRVDTWVGSGTRIGTFYDPMLAKVIVEAADRDRAFGAMAGALAATAVHGIPTNLSQLRAAVADPVVLAGDHTTATLASVAVFDRRIEVLRAGTMTTIQDHPGRLGYWGVGIPPSGPMDDLSFTLANEAVGNHPGATGLECTLQGPALRFDAAAVVCVAGAPTMVTVDGKPVPMWEPIAVPAGGVLDIGAASDLGLRTYLAIAGGIAAPCYLGSTATFTLGGFGGITGAAVTDGDVLPIGGDGRVGGDAHPVPAELRPELTHDWHLAVAPGPQTAPAYFTDADIEQFYRYPWRVGSHAGRTGIRLVGPKPEWSRTDGGDAGLHPSNLHDNPYSVGALNVSGDTPILLGPDGPSLGGFACPLTVVTGHRWKLGQLRPGDTVHFVPIDDDAARTLRRSRARRAGGAVTPSDPGDCGVLGTSGVQPGRPRVTYLRGGDDNILVEYGDMALDLGLRMRVHALAAALAAREVPGVIDITEGVRSLHIHYDSDTLAQHRLLGLLIDLEQDLPATDDLVVPSRRIRLPLCFDDPSIGVAIDRYRSGVRPNAPWLPSNIDFIRRINGLDDIGQVRDIVFAAEYLVLGLGDVYLGAPLAVPLDPRHRLVTTKYNPARTWTPADAVGIGGKYLCVYGMGSPGGYQLIGRTVPIWSTHRQLPPFDDGVPWLFRFFDRIVWEPVDADELAYRRADARAGRLDISVDHGTFALAEHRAFLREKADAITIFEVQQADAFARERRAWVAAGEFGVQPGTATSAGTAISAEADPPAAVAVPMGLPPGAVVVTAPMVGNVRRIEIEKGQRLAQGDPVATLEAMKLELPIAAPTGGTVLEVFTSAGAEVQPGTPLVAIGEPT